jgi:hypothetical protein
MATAKDIVLRPITSKEANKLVKRVHYSGKVVQNSQLHIGVFLDGILEGAMQFGPSLDKRKIQGLVGGTGWNEFLELNRMAFSDRLPRNSESRALAVSMRLMKKHAPQVKWVVTFADGTQCGDGTIYRAAGFALTGIGENKNLARLPDGSVIHKMTLESNPLASDYMMINEGKNDFSNYLKVKGAERLSGFQLRYIYFIDKSYRDRLTVPILPFSAIDDAGARMYKGEKITPLVNGDNLATSQAERFNPDSEAQ